MGHEYSAAPRIFKLRRATRSTTRFSKSIRAFIRLFEFTQFTKSTPKMAEADIRAYFAEHDADGNGSLSQAEIKEMLVKLGVAEDKSEEYCRVCSSYHEFYVLRLKIKLCT